MSGNAPVGQRRHWNSLAMVRGVQESKVLPHGAWDLNSVPHDCVASVANCESVSPGSPFHDIGVLDCFMTFLLYNMLITIMIL